MTTKYPARINLRCADCLHLQRPVVIGTIYQCVHHHLRTVRLIRHGTSSDLYLALFDPPRWCPLLGYGFARRHPWFIAAMAITGLAFAYHYGF